MTKFRPAHAPEEIARRFRADLGTGGIYRLTTHGQFRAGDRADRAQGDGYRRVTVGDRRYRAHQIIWVLAYGCWPSNEIDHINRDRSDNRLCNLREAATAEQARNRSGYGASPFSGVFRNKAKWRSRIEVDGRRIEVGTFADPRAAAAAHDAFAMLHHGEFASLNFPYCRGHGA